MKKVVFTFGILSGSISALMFSISSGLADKISMGVAEIVGYTTILVSAAFIFFGIRSYRENYSDGLITFGKAFKVGILITLVSSVIYVIAWEVVYYNFMPDFMEKYAGYYLEKLKSSGASAEKMNNAMQQMAHYKEFYKSPLGIAALTFLEPLPICLAVTLISSLVLKRKSKKEPGA
jgi:hypothetical protein